jgi:cyclase
MLKARVIPVMLWRDFTLVKGIAFNPERRVGSVMQAIKVYSARDVDELIIVDVAATLENKPLRTSEISTFASDCNVPLTIGGGVSEVKDIENLLQAGADKVSVNSMSYVDKSLVTNGANIFGTQCIVASVDYRMIDNRAICFSNSGTQNEGKSVVEWTKQMADSGAGEILLTNCDRDGTMAGYDIEMISKVSESVPVPVIASGGVGTLEHIFDGFNRGQASAVLAASIFHYNIYSIQEVKKYLFDKNIPIRM